MFNKGVSLKIKLPDAEATGELGRLLGMGLKPGHVLALIGELGAGKTTLVRGMVRGIGADPEQVHSPTFTMIHLYPGHLALYHVDLYRIDRIEELDAIGLDEALEGFDSACAVEWADKFPQALPPNRLEIKLAYDGEARNAELRATDESHGKLLQAIPGDWQVTWD